ncbi:HD-GYP domain-containing protein [Ideonella sp. YS5]|uniref:HD-GYP domain-containing protein n=1 Tax=Ideonella sp. YS5 TaxID=3453714 RepID=UPI003EE90A7E
MEPRQTVLIVDDTAENLSFLGELLRAEYAVRAASSGARALDLAARSPRPDLILLDIMMPGLSGFDVLQRLKQSPATSDIPVIFATAMDSKDDERKGLVLGAVDYVTKPLHPSVVLARVRTHLRLKQERDGLVRQNDSLQAVVTRGTREKQIAQDVTIRALARLAETRDNETGAHILRTQQMVLELARRASAHPRFACELDPHTIELIGKSAPLHDIGKVGVPDRVLLKPDRLTDEERAVMMTHARLGADVIARAEQDIDEPADFLKFARQIALHHHERWDGGGYPDHLAGTDIPLAARLMAIADVFDALISRRAYKPALALEEVLRRMRDERGRHFDPDLLDVFLEDVDAFVEIARRLPERPPQAHAAGAATPH